VQLDFAAMADGGRPIQRQGGKRRSTVGEQCAWAMQREIEAGPITERGFMLLEIGKMVKRIHERLKIEGFAVDELPKRREIKRWKNRVRREGQNLK
jgi:hypothetical protein